MESGSMDSEYYIDDFSATFSGKAIGETRHIQWLIQNQSRKEDRYA